MTSFLYPFIFNYFQNNTNISSPLLGAKCTEIFKNNAKDVTYNILSGKNIWKCRRDNIPCSLIVELLSISKIKIISILSNQWVKLIKYKKGS
jgi:hypothetical protein